MVELTAEEFAQRAFDVNLLDERQLQDVWGQAGVRSLSAEDLRQILLRRGLLTKLQAERLARGERTGYFYGDYKVLYLVGKGTFARVYRAVHRQTGQVVAVKVLRQRFAEKAEEAERFYREGLMGSTLRHPNVIPIFEVVKQADSPYLVMEFVEGRNLREFLKIRKKFEPAEALRLTTDICSGLSYAFERGICHRDLKASNILISSRGEAKLVDFGLAGGDRNFNEDLPPEMINPRTIDYVGLERASGVRKDDPRSDIYFLGCIFYHLLTGAAPLADTKDRIQRLSKTRFQAVVPVDKVSPDLPPAVAQIVTKAMDLNVGYRYQTPAEMLSDLKQAADRLAIPAAEPSAADPPGPVPATTAATATAQRAVMIVEANVELQDIFRQRLKTNGYRVLVTRDPARALDRFAENEKAADCVVFSTGELGESALEAFNRFAENPGTRKIPAVLLLGEQHLAWKGKAKLAEHRVVIAMPIKLKQFREVLARLVPTGQ